MKMLRFMKRHDIKEWSFVHILLGVIISLMCIVSGIYSVMCVFSFFIEGSFLPLSISLAILAVGVTCFIYVGEGKRSDKDD